MPADRLTAAAGETPNMDRPFDRIPTPHPRLVAAMAVGVAVVSVGVVAVRLGDVRTGLRLVFVGGVLVLGGGTGYLALELARKADTTTR